MDISSHAHFPGEDYAGPRQSGMMNIPSTYEGYNTQDMLNYPESKGAGFYEQMQDVADISGSLKAGQSNIPGTEDYNPAMSTIELPNVGELDVKTSLDLPEPFLPSEGTRQDTNSTGEKQTVSQLDKDLQTGEITQKEPLSTPDKKTRPG